MASAAGSATKSMAPSPVRTRSSGSLTRREAIWGYVFISPFLFGFFAFTFFPTIAALAMSFTNFKLSGGAFEFIGLQCSMIRRSGIRWA
jgi:multiple sugar transport system permease protein